MIERRYALRGSMLLLLFYCATVLCTAALAQQSAKAPEAPALPSDPATGSIHGTVQNPDGAVYEGVHVTLARPNVPDQTTTTGADGSFFFASVPPGPFTLTLNAKGFTTQTISGTIQPGQTDELPAITLAFAKAVSEVDVTASTAEISEAQLQIEEKQRVLGIVPNFYVAYNKDAPPLSPKQKFRLAWRTSIDPVTFGLSAFVAGAEQATGAYPGFGGGAQGYFKRFGASYTDGFTGTMLGNAIFPVLLHQDPRYFYKGTGSIRSRALYAIANAVICKGDNGHWQPNYSGILGSLASGGLSNLYYPASDRNGIGLTFQQTAIDTGASAIQYLFQEFVVRRLTPKLPSYNP
ncbi:carboxypeptidase-like regulatory domain-containing protein [Acidicapsa dinghuensis]|uniref:Carboxypeptidase-like regulatory domain-containing protein n=1 Tax=Acidicapsa dinghuensis TaxID=2218256 RepID=A0ABW1EDV9_9BACT|nr:carboxypeptidase-like regulatory domain-containing protein [Acidicapsa dinghuensis]